MVSPPVATRLSQGLVLVLVVCAAAPPLATAALIASGAAAPAAAPNVSTCQWIPVSQEPILLLGSGFTSPSWDDMSSKMNEAAEVTDGAGSQRVMYAAAQDMVV
jgi:hypothetical protein